MSIVAPRVRIKSIPVISEEINELIHFDNTYLRQVMKQIGVATDNLPPIFSRDEIEQGLSRGDQIEWVIVENEFKAGYFWFQKRADCFFLNGGAFKPEFYGKGLAQYALEIAEQSAGAAQLKNCELAVIPINSRALKCYFKAGYRVIQYVCSYFGSEHPDTFRLIKRKSLDNQNYLASSHEKLEISCSDQIGQKEAIDRGYIGIDLIPADSNAKSKIIFALNQECHHDI